MEASRKAYLQKYIENPKKKDDKSKKKKKKTNKPQLSKLGVVVVDEDPIWAKPLKIEEEEEDDSADEEKPQIEEDIEVKRAKRMELIRARNAASADGSGWVVVSDVRVKQEDLDSEDNADVSPPRRNRPNNNAGTEDVSPLRRNRPQLDNSGTEDMSPPRRRRLDEDMSPPRRRCPQSETVDDLSPPRKMARASPTADLSPPRKNKSSSKEEARTGLLSAQEIQMDIERKKKEELKMYKEMDPLMSGRGAEPIYRDKRSGNRMTKEEVLKLQKGEEKPKEKKLEWGKGLAQQREAEARDRELALEKERPFARSRDDPELDKMLKEQLRWGDPMAHLVKSKQPDLILEDFGENEKMKESGFIIPQKIPAHSWIIRKLDAPANRYGIRPGRHWDGVDRSNGYEKESFKRSNQKQANEKEAYLWSVADM